MKSAGQMVRAAAVCLLLPAVALAVPQKQPVHPRPEAASADFSVNDLKELSRSLKKKNSAPAFAKLSAFALQKNSGTLGLRASLALGYFEFTKGHFASAANWLARAQMDPLLRDYALYWGAEASRSLDRNAEALRLLKQARREFPDSVMTEQILQSLGEVALAAGEPEEAILALDGYSATTERAPLLFLRARALEQAGRPLQAASDYLTVYRRFPLSDQSPESRLKLAVLASSLAGQLPAIPLEERLSHADAVYKAKYWSEARSEYSALLPETSGADRERAELRVLLCGMSLGSGPAEAAALKISDPDVDAERYLGLANWYRNQQQGTEMAAAVESVVARAPASHWTEVALFLAGNFYWVQLDRDRAASYYKRYLDNFPAAPDATAAQWRVAWTAVLRRQPEASELLAQHILRFPNSPFTPDALYWLGRLAEEAGNAALARAYYAKLRDRFPQNYFEVQAVARLNSLGPGQEADPDVLAIIPPVPPVPPLGTSIPEAALTRQARADALRSVAFDSSAELELRAGYAATGEPRLLLETAQAAIDDGHCGAAFVAIRQIYPQLESRQFAEVPREVWMAAYPLPFESSIRRWSEKAGVDPMLAAGLIRQESAFEPEARSSANALGLMQLLSKTARLVAAKARVRYSHALLFDPDFNVRIGTLYLNGLQKDFGSVESALAAYNAGEDRVAQWTAGQNYREASEFVDSIPFTETREYVEIVTRNAEIYRKLYGVGASHEPRQASPRRKR